MNSNRNEPSPKHDSSNLICIIQLLFALCRSICFKTKMWFRHAGVRALCKTKNAWLNCNRNESSPKHDSSNLICVIQLLSALNLSMCFKTTKIWFRHAGLRACLQNMIHLILFALSSCSLLSVVACASKQKCDLDPRGFVHYVKQKTHDEIATEISLLQNMIHPISFALSNCSLLSVVACASKRKRDLDIRGFMH